MSTISIKSLNKSYGSVKVLHDIDLDIEDNSFVVFVGPSGCGKSTLLRTIAGLEDVSSGEIRLNDRDISDEAPVDRDIAMVFQSYALYPQMSVEQNIGFALEMAGVSKSDIKTRVAQTSKLLKLDQLLQRKPKDLSGGQRQRVAIGRAILRDPEVFLFDEPLSNLDAELRVDMRLQIAALRRDLSATFIYVTHDQIEAMTLADRIVVLREGRIEQVGAPLALYHDPDNVFVAGFMGSPKMNFLSATAEGNTITLTEQCALQLPENFSLNRQPVTLGVRPEHVRLLDHEVNDNPPSVMPLHVITVEDLGAVSYAYGETTDGERVTVQLEPDHDLHRGDMIQVDIEPSRLLVFNEAGDRLRAP